MSTAPDIDAGLKHFRSDLDPEWLTDVVTIIEKRFVAEEYKQVMAPLGSLASCYNALALQAGIVAHRQ